jgi:hypothetical protein
VAIRIDEFSGVINAKGKFYTVRDINMRSGLLVATGQVKVKPNKTLDGAVDKIKGLFQSD